MNAQDDNHNLALEVLSLLLFLVALLFLLPAVLATAIYLGIEIVPELMPDEERARFGPYGYQIVLGSLLAPAVAIGFLLLGIRLWLVRRPLSEDGIEENRES